MDYTLFKRRIRRRERRECETGEKVEKGEKARRLSYGFEGGNSRITKLGIDHGEGNGV